MAKTEVQIVESPTHSLLIYVLNNNQMYASELADKVKEQQGTIQRRLMKLRKEGFVKLEEHPDKIKNIKLFSLNWNKVIEEFFKLLREHKKEFLETHNRLKSNIKEEKLNDLKLLDSKAFLEDMKKNKYLLKVLSEYFSAIARIKYCSLSSAFGYFLFFGNLDFGHSTHPSLYGFLSWRETIKDLEKKDNEKLELPESKEDFKKFKQAHNKMMDTLMKRQKSYEEKINEIVNKDKDLQNLLRLNLIFRTLSSDLGLQISLNEAIELSAFFVVQNHFSDKEIEQYQDKLFFKHSKKYKDIQKEEIDKLKKKTSKVQNPSINDKKKKK